MVLKKQQLRMRLGVMVGECSERNALQGKFLSLHYDVHAPSCSIDSCLSSSDLSLAVVSGSLGRQFVGVKEILK